MNTLDLANHGPVIPVIVINRVEDAVPMAEALLEGGIRVLEVTLRTSCALKGIEAIAKAVPDAILGSGTVRTLQDAQASKDAGCSFAVSPGYTHFYWFRNYASECRRLLFLEAVPSSSGWRYQSAQGVCRSFRGCEILPDGWSNS